MARRPLPVAVLALAVLIALALPATHMRLATSDASTYKKDDTTRIAYDLLKQGFGPGFNAPLLLAVELPRGGRPRGAAADRRRAGRSGRHRAGPAAAAQ